MLNQIRTTNILLDFCYQFLCIEQQKICMIIDENDTPILPQTNNF